MADAALHNLPIPPNPLLGRQEEVALARRLLTQSGVRLVTLTGPPGVGKTRLAVEIARSLVDDFPHGARFVDLSHLFESSQLLPFIARVLGASESFDRSGLEGLIEFLQDRRLLLVLDNFEPVVAGATDLARILSRCPQVQFLVTSRALLRLRWEHQVTVPSLSFPHPDQVRSAADLHGYPATALFVRRMLALKPDLDFDRNQARGIAEVCRRLDGLPLAIELAASRSRVLSLDALLGRLDSQLSLLDRGDRDLPARQQSLRRAIEASYDLLSPGEQALFRRLSVFVGGFTAEGAAEVADRPGCPDAAPTAAGLRDDELLDLTALVEHSLVREEVGGDVPRFGLLAAIREFAAEQREAAGETTATCRRHARCFQDLAIRLEPDLWAVAPGPALTLLESEQGNLRAALSWTLANDDAVMALRFANALWRFWSIRGHLKEGLAWLEAALERSDPGTGPLRARAFEAAGNLARTRGDYTRAVDYHQAGLEERRVDGDPWGIALSLNNLAVLAHDAGRLTDAQALFEQCLERLRDVGDRRAIAFTLSNLAGVLHEQGENGRAAELFEESITLFHLVQDRQGVAMGMLALATVARDNGDVARAQSLCLEGLNCCREIDDRQGMASALAALGELATDFGDAETALGRYEESLSLSRELGDKQGAAATQFRMAKLSLQRGNDGLAISLACQSLQLFDELAVPGRAVTCLELLADIAVKHAQQSAGVRFLALADRLRSGEPVSEHQGRGPSTPERRVYHLARVALGEEAFRSAWFTGQTLTIAQVVEEVAVLRGDLVRSTSPAGNGSAQPGSLLTPREHEVAALIASGLSNRDIATKLIISERTAANHVEHILNKLNLRSRTQVAAWLIRQQAEP